MKIDVRYSPEFIPNSGGTVTEVSWNTLKRHLEKAFALRTNESLIGLEVSDYGIKAFFKLSPTMALKSPRQPVIGAKSKKTKKRK